MLAVPKKGKNLHSIMEKDTSQTFCRFFKGKKLGIEPLYGPPSQSLNNSAICWEELEPKIEKGSEASVQLVGFRGLHPASIRSWICNLAIGHSLRGHDPVVLDASISFNGHFKLTG